MRDDSPGLKPRGFSGSLRRLNPPSEGKNSYGGIVVAVKLGPASTRMPAFIERLFLDRTTPATYLAGIPGVYKQHRSNRAVDWLLCDVPLPLPSRLSCVDGSRVFYERDSLAASSDAFQPVDSDADFQSCDPPKGSQSATSPGQCLSPHGSLLTGLTQLHKQTRCTTDRPRV